ncbi:prepilin-type N-terminal cleavage/methylation domain-containing protein [Chloroflexota bacterium]
MRWLNKIKSEFTKKQKGFSLLEVLVAIGILALIGVSILRALDTNYKTWGICDEQAEAANLAVAHIEAIKELPYASTYPNASENITIPNQYNIVIDTECSYDGDNFTSCTGSENETFQRITILISREEGKPVFSLCSYRMKR